MIYNNTEIGKVLFGANELQRVYYGQTLVYEKASDLEMSYFDTYELQGPLSTSSDYSYNYFQLTDDIIETSHKTSGSKVHYIFRITENNICEKIDSASYSGGYGNITPISNKYNLYIKNTGRFIYDSSGKSIGYYPNYSSSSYSSSKSYYFIHNDESYALLDNKLSEYLAKIILNTDGSYTIEAVKKLNNLLYSDRSMYFKGKLYYTLNTSNITFSVYDLETGEDIVYSGWFPTNGSICFNVFNDRICATVDASNNEDYIYDIQTQSVIKYLGTNAFSMLGSSLRYPLNVNNFVGWDGKVLLYKDLDYQIVETTNSSYPYSERYNLTAIFLSDGLHLISVGDNVERVFVPGIFQYGAFCGDRMLISANNANHIIKFKYSE